MARGVQQALEEIRRLGRRSGLQNSECPAMDNVGLITLSRQIALRRQMDIVANNIANMNTSGFKSESALFEEFLTPVATAGGEEDLSFVNDYGLHRDLSPGGIKSTSNPMDIAINGEGYFVVSTPEGERYTRNGHFKLDPDGQIATNDGFSVLDKGGQAINIGLNEGPITVSKDGTVTTSLGVRGQFQVVTFEFERRLEKVGDNLYKADQIPIEPEALDIVQGAIEQSNVKAVVEMTRMIDISRSYQSAAKLRGKSEELRTDAIKRLGRVSA